ncbi:MAG: ROK family protein [Candidatus Nealsonbacteria bacterium]|nr:ROK family protein [Candidatus Nealsonbacteria bacterium]
MTETNGKNGRKRLYLGVDIGGTKVQASLVEESGGILGRQRCATPRDGSPDDVLDAIERAMTDVVEKKGLTIDSLAAIGIAVPGVVDPDTARVIVTPNMNLSGVEIGAHLEARFGVPIAVGNDCNLGALGEKWLGSARDAESAMAILVGTGIGGGFVQKGKLWRGARESASEIGHIVMQIDGPMCGCGNRGCLEALASRSAIERDIREAVAAGKSTVLTALLDGDLSVIRSGMLRRAMAAGDELVTKIMHRATEVIGYACLTVRHLLDPDVIVLGGGVVEGNSRFMMPIVESIVASDQLPGAREGGRVLLSALGDDAVVLGAVALARRRIDRSPFKRRFCTHPKYPQLAWVGFGEVAIGKKAYTCDVFITVGGKVKKRDKTSVKQFYGTSHTVGPAELESVCKGGPAMLFVGAGAEGRVELNEEAREFLVQRSICHKVLPTPDAIEAYNGSDQRKAILLHVTC